MSHTPGPWVAWNDQVDDDTPDHLVRRPDIRSLAPGIMGNIVCEAPISFLNSMAGWPENARLIAAAPDLLAACEALLAACDERSGEWPTLATIENLARAAIAKAKGEAEK